jgi:protein involved in polysaccharide export with SLBB domain
MGAIPVKFESANPKQFQIMKRIILLIIILVFSAASLMAQQIPSLPNNLNSVRSSDISDEQIVLIAQQMKQNKVTTKEAYQLMLQRGMSIVEANLITQRIDRVITAEQDRDLKPGGKEDENDFRSDPRGTRTMTPIKTDTFTVKNPKKIFGLEIFNNGVLQLIDQDIQIATPMNYIIGPGDEIVVNIYGYQEAKHTLRVSPEGDITVPYAGSIYVAGLTIEQATIKIKNRLAASGYSNIRTGLTKVNVSIGRIRSIKVTILGEVNKPGTYTIPSLATVFNALYLSGGPNEIGSMRNIQVIRNGKLIDQLDMYDFLINGNQSGNILLRDQDVIRIPPYTARVSFDGEVKRTGLFEVKEGENLQQVLNYAGGFTDSAYTASIKAYKITDTEKKIFDISKDKFTSYFPSRSESYVVGKVIDRFANRVILQGAVYLPGEYELTPGMTVGDLLKKAQGLKEEAYLNRGIITRVRNDLTEEVIAFSPSLLLRGAEKDIVLQKDDQVTISSVLNFRDKQTVLINGEVRKPGEFTFRENMSLKDALVLAGGFTDAATPQRIEIARRIKREGYDTSDLQIAEVINVESLSGLDISGKDVKLFPWDVIVVRKNPSYRTQVNVRIEGEVAYPGNYVLQSKNERVSALLKRAGGLTREAYPNGVYLKRLNSNSVVSQLTTQKVNKIQQQLKDTSMRVAEEVLRPFDQMAINLTNVLNSPGGIDDIILEEGDVLTVPQRRSEVRITGEVLFPTQVVYEDNMTLEDYLGRAGGVTEGADSKRIYVLYPNGNAGRTTRYLFGKKYPVITPGAEIIVPKKPESKRQRLSTAELVGITTAITAMAAVLVQLLKK